MNRVKYKQRLVNINIKVVMEKSMYAFEQIVNNILINSLLPTDKCALQLAGFDNYDLRFPNDRKLQDNDNNSNDLFSNFGRMLFAAPKSEISKAKKGINKSDYLRITRLFFKFNRFFDIFLTINSIRTTINFIFTHFKYF